MSPELMTRHAVHIRRDQSTREDMMFRRHVHRDESWEGVITGKKRSSPDGQNMIHRVTLALSDGSSKEIHVRRRFWKELAVGDRLVKQAGDKRPAKIEQAS
jgi:hypothetical protein